MMLNQAEDILNQVEQNLIPIVNQVEQVNQNELLNLNEPDINQDLDPLLIHPVENGPFGQGEQIRYLLQDQGEVYLLNQQPQIEENINLELALEVHEEQELNLNQVQEDNVDLNLQLGSPVQFLMEEI